jgi:hypothetical protein
MGVIIEWVDYYNDHLVKSECNQLSLVIVMIPVFLTSIVSFVIACGLSPIVWVFPYLERIQILAFIPMMFTTLALLPLGIVLEVISSLCVGVQTLAQRLTKWIKGKAIPKGKKLVQKIKVLFGKKKVLLI